MYLGIIKIRPTAAEAKAMMEALRALPRPKKKRKPAPNTCSCSHAADMTFEWAPGHRGGLICDCCIKKIWENTLANVTKSLTELKMRCP